MSAVAVRESALVLLVPEAEESVGRWRAELDPSAAWGVPGHITLLYPFVPPDGLDDIVVDAVAEVAARCEPFAFRLDRVAWFDDRVVWLAPEPAEPIVELTRALLDRFPEHPRYGGKYGDAVIVPHLTIGQSDDLARMQEAAAAAGAHLPIEAAAAEVAVLVGTSEPGSWRVEHLVPLAGRR